MLLTSDINKTASNRLKPSPKDFRKNLANPLKQHFVTDIMIRTETLINKPNLTNLTMLATLKVSSKGQIVIPETIRKNFNITQGTNLILIEKGTDSSSSKKKNS